MRNTSVARTPGMFVRPAVRNIRRSLPEAGLLLIVGFALGAVSLSSAAISTEDRTLPQCVAQLEAIHTLWHAHRAAASMLGQLVDYAAMVGLADINLDADLGDVPSILRIFEEPAEARPAGLTHWDEAFLAALYHSDQATQTLRSQIAVKMSHDILP